MNPDILSVTFHDPADGVRVLSVAGEIDHDSVEVLRDAVERALADGRDRLVCDLSAVPFCDSGGLSLFVETHRRATARGGWLRLAGPQDQVRFVLDVANLDRYLGVHPTLDEALSAAGQ
ncbi:STAS domain-containing protein [Couchioplanes azureus]|uniref:STAS domain-containing protein n=1 Tax=Couchioplanes caeruleus TaxID=56438 RepID=UPI001670662A|nr:STAS domain-containing protein [Couchioplanes caeruleus]GGQ61010.1 anti-sigma factor antagonist [Couchioplanes caeruleus subsp. azureus]